MADVADKLDRLRLGLPSVSEAPESPPPPDFSSLPHDVAVRLLAALAGEDARDACAAACVCDSWAGAATAPAAWRTLCVSDPDGGGAAAAGAGGAAAPRPRRGSRVTDARLTNLVARSSGGCVSLRIPHCASVTCVGLQCLASHPNLVRLDTFGCERVREHGLCLLAGADTLADVVARLRAYARVPAAVQRCALAVGCCVDCEPGDAALGVLGGGDVASAAGAVPSLVAALLAHPAHAGVQQTGLAALWRLTVTEARACAAADAGALAACLSALQRHETSAAVAEEACAVLNNLVFESVDVRSRAQALGLASVVVASLCRHAAHPGATREGSLALANLTAAHPMQTQAQAAVAAAQGHALWQQGAAAQQQQQQQQPQMQLDQQQHDGGGAPSLAAAAAAAAAAQHLQPAGEQHAQQHTSSTGGGGSGGAQPAPPAPASSSPGIVALLSALRTHYASPDVVENACMALNNACAASVLARREAGAAGAVPTLLHALSTHPDHDGIQDMALAALAAVIHLDVANAAAATAGGAVPLVAAALRAYPASEEVQYSGCSCLADLAGAPDAAGEAIACGAVALLDAADSAFPAPRGDVAIEVHRARLGLGLVAPDAEPPAGAAPQQQG